MGSSSPLPNNLLPLLLNYTYTLISYLSPRQAEIMEILVWPTTTTHHHILCHTQRQTRRRKPSFLQQIFIPFIIFLNFLSSPAAQTLAACVSLPRDYRNRLQMGFILSASLRRCKLFSQAVLKHPPYLFCNFTVDQSFTSNCFSLKICPPLSKLF